MLSSCESLFARALGIGAVACLFVSAIPSAKWDDVLQFHCGGTFRGIDKGREFYGPLSLDISYNKKNSLVRIVFHDRSLEYTEKAKVSGKILVWHHVFGSARITESFDLEKLAYGYTTGQKGPDRVDGSAACKSVTAGGEQQQPSIGRATMDADGTIVLQLRAESSGGALGDALLRYPPSHPQYRSILDHLGGLRPGETKLVPPWS